MRSISFCFLFMLAILMAGCVTTNPKSINPLVFNAQDNSYTHDKSDFLFPPSIGNFKRGNDIQQHDTAGNNISVPYNLITNNQKIVGTVFVYPGMKEYAITPIPKFGQTPDWFFNKHYDEVKSSIFDYYRARLISEADFKLTRSIIENKGKKAIFEWDVVNGETVYSHLYLFAHKGWLIKYRFTYPSKFDDLVISDIEAFIKLLNWP